MYRDHPMAFRLTRVQRWRGGDLSLRRLLGMKSPIVLENTRSRFISVGRRENDRENIQTSPDVMSTRECRLARQWYFASTFAEGNASTQKIFQLVSCDACLEGASQCRRTSVGIGCHGFQDRERVA